MRRTQLKPKISYCGIVCSNCPAYVSSRKNQAQVQVKIAKLWSDANYTYDACEITCKGCSEAWGKKFKHCAECGVRECARHKVKESCAECPDYPCEKLECLYKTLDKKIVRINLDTLKKNKKSSETPLGQTLRL